MLSVLIVNWNTREFLRACLDSLIRFPASEPMEIIVVDNDSQDGSAEMVKSVFPSVQLIEPGRNSGYAAGNNYAFAAATGDWLLTLNPDTEVLEHTLQNAIDKLKASPGYGALGVRQIYAAAGETQQSVRGFPSFWGIVGDMTGLAHAFPHSKLGSYRLHAFDYDKEQDAPQPMGTFLLFRREALSAPRQPFDEKFPIFFNEVDLLFRLKEAGWKTLYTPEVQIRHHGAESTKQVRKSMIWESHRSLVRFFRKHYRTPLTAPFLPLFAGLVFLGALVRARGYDGGFRP